MGVIEAGCERAGVQGVAADGSVLSPDRDGAVAEPGMNENLAKEDEIQALLAAGRRVTPTRSG